MEFGKEPLPCAQAQCGVRRVIFRFGVPFVSGRGSAILRGPPFTVRRRGTVKYRKAALTSALLASAALFALQTVRADDGSAELHEFSADIKVGHIPEFITFADPLNITGDDTGNAAGWIVSYAISFGQKTPPGPAYAYVELYGDCNWVHCPYGKAVSMAPEQALSCSVHYISNTDYKEWPCRFSVNATRDTFHIEGLTFRFVPEPEAELDLKASYKTGPIVVTDVGGACVPARYSLATFTETTENAQYDFAGLATRKDWSCDGVDAVATPEMDAASRIHEAHLTLTPQPVSPIELNQHGLTGGWINAATPGEGFLFEDYPGIGDFTAGWYTYDVESGGANKQRWYVMQGSATDNPAQVDFSILSGWNGNFDAKPNVPMYVNGYATMRLDSCTHGTLEYFFYDGRQGSIKLQRYTPNVDCVEPGQAVPAAPEQYLLSGNWVDPDVVGQGIQFEFSPEIGLLFATWYTYAPAHVDPEQRGGLTAQRWFTFQSLGVDPDAKEIHDIGIYSTTEGVFNSSHPTATEQVGTADLVFDSCYDATLSYHMTAGENAGSSRDIHLKRVGPAPEGCNF